MSASPAAPTIAFGAERSNRRYRLRLARYKALAETVAVYVREHAGAAARKLDLLDVGQGSGRSLAFLETEGVADQLVFHGVDNSDARLASVYKPERWQLERADVAQGLPYEDNRFDVCLCEQVLEHLHDPGAVLSEVARVLRPGGLAIFGVPIFPPGLAQLRGLLAWSREKIGGKASSHVQTFTCRSLCALIRGHEGLAIVERRGFRVVSGGVLSKLEDFHWWYRFNRSLGRIVPALCTEIQIVARRRGT